MLFKEQSNRSNEQNRASMKTFRDTKGERRSCPTL
jgi:hypothetical protein